MAERVTSTRSITFEEFVERYAHKRYEYVAGCLLPMGPEMLDAEGEWVVAPTKGIHGLVVTRITSILDREVVDNELGGVFSGEMGFLMQQDPREIRAADVSVFSTAQLKAIPNVYEWFPFPPDLAVEVVSEYDRVVDLRRKAQSYMAHGTRLLWVVYPEDREIEVFRPGQVTRTLTGMDVLDGGDVLPGVSVPVKSIFVVLDILGTDED